MIHNSISRPVRRKSERRRTIESLDKLWRETLIAIHGSRCLAAGQGGLHCGGGLQGHHIYSKGTWPALRFDLENGVLACRNHHLYWIETAPSIEVGPWLERVCGEQRLLRLRVRAAASRGGRTKLDLAAIRVHLKQSSQLKLASQQDDPPHDGPIPMSDPEEIEPPRLR